MKDSTKTEGWKLAQEKSRKTQKLQKQQRIDNYNKNPKLCKACNVPIKYEKRISKFCNHSCSASYNNKGKRKWGNPPSKLICNNCNKNFKTKYNKKYCSIECSTIGRNKIRIRKIELGLTSDRKTLRTYLIQKFGYFCDICKLEKWSDSLIALELDHIDGNAANNKPENLRKLCPNCHSTTKTWKGRNKGYGRKSLGLTL